MKANKLDLSLYFVTDRDLCGGEEALLHVIEDVLLGGVTLLQLREKSLSDREFVHWGMKVKRMLRGKGVPLIVNDRLDVAQIISADGLHVGPSDIDYKSIRSLMGKDFIVGLSVESLKEVEEAEEWDVDYLAISPVFSTSTKNDTVSPFGIEGLRRACDLSRHPLVAIGGIHEKNIKSVLECGVDGVAVVSALAQSSCPKKAAAVLKEKILEEKKKKKKKKKEENQSFSSCSLSQVERLSDISEWDIVRFFERKNFKMSSVSLKKNQDFDHTSCAPSFSFGFLGDDCAVLEKNENLSYLVSTDSLVENVHFLRDTISPFDLGYKSLAVNLSDIAAMGGRPLFFFLAMSLPKSLRIDWLRSFSKGMEELSKTHRVRLAGGDTTSSSKHIFINLTVIGERETKHIKHRSQAQLGDAICVTDTLGDSRGGLKCLLEDGDLDFSFRKDKEFQRSRDYLIKKHLSPLPPISEGLWLSKHSSVHSMMDLSDGLHSDIQRIMEASGCGVRIFLDQIPVSSSFHGLCQRLKIREKEEALMGGEDYALLFTLNPKYFLEVSHSFFEVFHRPLFRLGEVVEAGLNYVDGGKTVKIQEENFSHFK